MVQTAIDTLNLATKIVPQFNGSLKNLQGFLDALQPIDTLKATHEGTVVEVIKTRLMGNARTLITTENSIKEIANTLKKSTKGETTEVITAKIMANKTANVFVAEKDDLAKQLPGAYFADGVPKPLADKYTIQTAVKALCC